MLIRQLINIEHNLGSVEDKVILVDKNHLLVFFFKKSKYLIYSLAQKTILKIIQLDQGTRDAHYFNPQYILTHIPLQRKIQKINSLNGQVLFKFVYEDFTCIPEIKILSVNKFGVLNHITAEKSTLNVYNSELIFQRKVNCDRIVESFNDSSLVSYNQRGSKLKFMIIGQEAEQAFEFEYSMQQKLLMKVVQKNENQIIFVERDNLNTLFNNIKLTDNEVTEIFSINKRLADLLIYDPHRQLFVSHKWQFWSKELDQEPISLVINSKQNNFKMLDIKLRKGVISNIIKDVNYRFCCYKQNSETTKTRIQFYFTLSYRNSMIDVLTRGGITQIFGDKIVKKVLQVMDY